MALLSKVSTDRVLAPAVAILIGLITLTVFLPALQNGFVNWDDDANLVNNPNFRGFDWDHLQWMWTNHLGARYIPLTWMSFGLDYVIWQGDKFGYHLTNIVLHAANAALFYLLTLALFKRTFAPSTAPLEGAWRAGAIFSALFFGLHPLRVESVAWVTERRDVLSGLFFILLLLVYLRSYPQEHNGPEMDRKGYWICLALFIMAILSKEIVVTVPVLLLLLDIYPLRRLGGGPGRWFGREVRSVWLEKVPFFAIAFADSVMAIYVAIQSHLVEPVGVLGWMSRIAISVYGMAFYVHKTVLPFGLSPFYPVTLLKIDRGATPFQLSAALVLGITLIALLLRRRFPALLAVWIAFAVILLPVGGIIHNGLQIAADRYSYLACLGFALLAGALLSHVWKALQRYRTGLVLLAGFASLLLMGLSFLTQKQIAVWHDSDSLWTHAIAIEPSFVAHLNLGSSMVNEGDSSGAVVHLRQAIDLWPNHAGAHNNLGKAYLNLKDWEDAAGEFRRVIQLAPAPAAYNSLAHALAMQGRLDEAIASLREALRIAPDDAVASRNLEAILALKMRHGDQ